MVRLAQLSAFLLAILLIVTPSAALAQMTTAVVTGTVKDAQGAVIPGATVTLVSEARGTTVGEVITTENGDYVFPNVPGDTYTVQVTLTGFKTLRRPGVAASPGDRVSVPPLIVELGTLSETVVVVGEAPLIQAQSGERSFTVTTQSVENLPIANRNFAGFAALVPGAIAQTGTAIAGGVQRLGGGGQNNIMMDGVSTMDTGNNGQLIQMNVEAIAEVKVLSQGYQAEFGRSSGLQISAVTKSGTNRFTGAVYMIDRNSDWNANSWVNVKNGDPKAVSKQRDWGYAIGGPIGKPGGDNNLFFFYSHEYRPRTSGGDVNRFRVPTVLERQGDFSQIARQQRRGLQSDSRRVDQSAVHRGRHAGLFSGWRRGRQNSAEPFVPDRHEHPAETSGRCRTSTQVPGLGYNYEVTVPNLSTLTPSTGVAHRLSAVVAMAASRANMPGQVSGKTLSIGSMPGLNDTLGWNPTRHAPSVTVDYNLTSTMFLEATYGYSFNEIDNLFVSPLSNRVNAGLGDLPMLYPAGRHGRSVISRSRRVYGRRIAVLCRQPRDVPAGVRVGQPHRERAAELRRRPRQHQPVARRVGERDETRRPPYAQGRAPIGITGSRRSSSATRAPHYSKAG